MKRRDLIKQILYTSLGGSVGLHVIEEYMRGIPSSHFSSSSLDAFDFLKKANHYGYQNKVWQPQAYAAPSDGVNIIFIRVMNLIHTPLYFKFLDYTGPNTSRSWEKSVQSKDTRALLESRGIHDLSEGRFGDLRLNKWFADMLKSGKDESNVAIRQLSADEKGDFPDEVALQCFLHVNQNIVKENHSFKNTLLEYSGTPGLGGDLGYHLHHNNIVHSPFGIAAFNMGRGVETTDGSGRIANRVLGHDLQQLVAQGKSVRDYVNILMQSLGVGFVDQKLVEKVDRFTGVNGEIREALNASRAKIQSQLARLNEIGDIESLAHDMGAIKGANNIQAGDGNIDVTASMEFLSQCMLASNLLDIPGAPIRNFSMLLNIFDIDNSSLDNTSAQGISRPYSNIEGARQLALGMNVLAHVIKRHPKTIVVMASEGGRGKNGGDNKVSHMFVMGSKATADMGDHLYTDPSIFNDSSHPFNNEPNAGNAGANNSPGLIQDGSGLAYYQQGELKSASSGQSIKNKYVTVSSVLNGVVRKMESMSGVASESSSVADLGDYVELIPK